MTIVDTAEAPEPGVNLYELIERFFDLIARSALLRVMDWVISAPVGPSE